MARSKTKSEPLVLQELDKIRKEVAELKKNSEAVKDAALKQRYDDFRKKYFRSLKEEDEDLDDDTDKPPVPEEDGRWQLHKGGNKDPNTWKVVKMTRNENMWKIVDDSGTNIADLYHSEQNAQKAIDDAKAKADAGETPEPAPQPVPSGDETPYPAKSPKMASTERGPTIRHYKSGKPDDNTYERNIKEIEFDNYQAVFEIDGRGIEWEHDDNYSVKGGGTHMGTGWFDSGVGVFTGQCCLGVEPDHPSTDLCVEKGPSIGDQRDKVIKVAWVYRNGDNYQELWTNTGNGWEKQVSATNLDNFNPESDVDEVQLRIDGFKDLDNPPKILQAFVTEI